VSDLRDVLLHSKNYLSANIFAKLLLVISLPVFTSLLDTSEYGYYQLFLSYLGLFSVILTLNFNGSVARYYYDQPSDYGEFISTSLLGSLVILAGAAVLIFAYFDEVAGFLKIPTVVMVLLICSVLMSIFIAIFNHVSIAKSNSSVIAKISVFRSYSSFFIGLCLVLWLGENKYLGLIYAEVLVSVMLAVFCFYKLLKIIKWSFKKSHLHYIVSYSIALLPYVISGQVLAQIDRVMINNFFSVAEVGLYSVGYNVGALLLMVIGAINSALLPKWFELKREGKVEQIEQIETQMHCIILFFASGLVFFTDEIYTLLVNKEFSASREIVAAVTIACVFDSIFKIYGRTIGYTKKMIYVSLVGLIAAVVNVVLNYIFLPKYGYIAGAYTTLISSIVMTAMAWWIAKYYLKQKTISLLVFILPTFWLLLAVSFMAWMKSIEFPYWIELSLRISCFVAMGVIYWKSMRSYRVSFSN